MGNIVLLDDLTINKIAAGEVIERPASVVKEMVENSIDAGSKNITVEIKNGGISLIKITDDGCGIAEDDMEIAFERHATSKIRSANDLTTVTTMGFRGEALASIASIANVEMISKKQGEEIGHKIVVEGGKVLEKSEIGCPVGTTITVKNLFFNTPVRYKFLKKDYTEAGYIEDAVKRIALVNKDIAIKLINSGKTIIQTNGSGNFKNIIYSIYGKDIANSIMEVEYQYEDIKITGVIGKPEIARANRQNQTFFVNNRFVKDKNLTSAVDQAYKDLIPSGKFGFVILNLEMNPEKLDVNVHPAKLEVRFQDENAIFHAVYYAIKVGFGNENIQNEEISKTFITENKSVGEKKPVENIDLKIKDGMSIEERINAINSVINKISSEKIEKPVQEKISYDNIEQPKAVQSDNFIEDIYRRGFITQKTPNYISNINEKEEIIAEENTNTIKIGNTKISSDTQEIPVIQSDIMENLQKEGITQVISKDDELQQENTIDEKEDLPKENINIVEEVEKIYSDDVKKENKDDDFVENVENNLLESKLKISENTEIIDTSKVREALKETPEVTADFEEMYKKAFGVDLAANRKEENKEIVNSEEKLDLNDVEYVKDLNQSLFEAIEEYQEVKYKFIGIAFSDYIIIEMKDEMYMIDQKLAYERIIYEKLKNNYDNEEGETQFLLLPDIVTLTERQMDIARENIEMFEKAGFHFEEFGENTIKVVSVPNACEALNTKQLFLEILDNLNTVAVIEIREKEEKFLATIAKKIAKETKINLDIEEVEKLMKELLKLQNPFSTPNGKSSAIKMTKYDLDRKFNRC